MIPFTGFQSIYLLDFLRRMWTMGLIANEVSKERIKMDKQTFFREDAVGDATIQRETPIETADFMERLPFDPFNVLEMQAYLADMSSKGLILKEAKQWGNVLVYDRMEPQKRSYRLLLGVPVLENSLLESFYTDGWDLVYSRKRTLFGLLKAYAVFSSFAADANDFLFRENNKKYSAILSPARDFFVEELCNILIWCVFLGFVWLLFQKAPDMTLFSLALAELLMGIIRRCQSYRVKENFKRTFQNETVELENGIVNWQLAKISYENMENLGYSVGFIAILL